MRWPRTLSCGTPGNACAREVRAHDRPPRRTRIVARVEAASGEHGNPERREEIAADDPLLHREAASVERRAGQRTGADLGVPRVIAAGRRQTGDAASGRHARNRLEPAGQFLLERRPARRVVASSSADCTSKVRTRSTRTPTSTCCRRWKLASRTPAPATSVSASATCAAASAPRSRASPRAPVAERDCWRSASTGDVPARRSAGATPKATAVTAVATSANSQHLGVEPDARRAVAARRARGAAARERRRLPGRVRPRRRGTPAGGSRPAAGGRAGDGSEPSAARTANSCTRPVARTRTRLATFTHATSRTSTTAANTRCRGPRALATSSSCSGTATIALFSAAGHRSRIGRRQRRQFRLRPFQA